MSEDILKLLNSEITRSPISAEADIARAAIQEIEKLRAERDAARDKALEEAASLVEDELWRGAGCARHIRALKDQP